LANLTDAELTQAVADGQGAVNTTALPVYWPSTIPRANREAFNALRSKLLGRGFTLAQVTAWLAADEGRDWNATLGVCKAYWNVSKASEDRGEPFRREWTELMEQLDELVVIINGELITPTGPGVKIGYGEYSDTSDIHTIDDEL